MAFFSWIPEYSVGVASIDDQHQQVVSLVSRLHEAGASGGGREEICPALDCLVDLAHTHFAHEEQLMREHAYPGFPEHQAVHEGLVAKVAGARAQVHSGNAKLTDEVLETLRRAIAAHILCEDMHFGAYLSARGVS